MLAKLNRTFDMAHLERIVAKVDKNSCVASRLSCSSRWARTPVAHPRASAAENGHIDFDEFKELMSSASSVRNARAQTPAPSRANVRVASQRFSDPQDELKEAFNVRRAAYNSCAHVSLHTSAGVRPQQGRQDLYQGAAGHIRHARHQHRRGNGGPHDPGHGPGACTASPTAPPSIVSLKRSRALRTATVSLTSMVSASVRLVLVNNVVGGRTHGRAEFQLMMKEEVPRG